MVYADERKNLNDPHGRAFQQKNIAINTENGSQYELHICLAHDVTISS